MGRRGSPLARTETVPSPKPRRRSDVRVRSIDGETVVLDRARELIHQLNPSASLIWMLCDGDHTVGQMVRELSGAFEVTVAVAEQDVAAVLDRFGRLGLLEP